MNLLDKHADDIRKLCALHHVKTLYAFGSAVSGNLDKHSDFDFIVDFDKVDLETYADNYFNLKFSLEDVLKRPVDLLEGNAIRNPYFNEVVARQRKLVYGH